MPKQIIRIGDCVELLHSLKSENIDIVVTSPPYNIGIDYENYSDCLSPKLYQKFMRSVAKQLARVVKAEGSVFLNVGGTNVDPWIPFMVAEVFREFFTLQNHMVWVKSITIDTGTRGHFKPINSNRFLNNNHEQIFHFTKKGTLHVNRLAIGVPYQDKSNIERFSGSPVRCRGNTWFIPYETVNSSEGKFQHPAGFPLALPSMCMSLHGPGRVLDPFCGAGTTLVAARLQGRDALGFELSEHYAEIARERLTRIPQNSIFTTV